jgi:hypothetical protein
MHQTAVSAPVKKLALIHDKSHAVRYTPEPGNTYNRIKIGYFGMVHKAEVAPYKSTAPVIPSGVFGARNPYGLVE